MTKKILQNKHKNLKEFNLDDTELSIQLSLDGFSFCIYDGLSEQFLSVEHHDFEESINNPEKHLELVAEIIENNPLFQNKFREIKVVHSNNLIAQVPEPLFDKTRLQEYLKYSVKLLENDFISYDQLDNTDLVNVYVPFVNINNYLLDNYGSFVFKHSATVLIEKLLAHCKNTEGNHVYVNVNKTDFETIVIQNKKFVLYNRFNFKTKEDFIYYLLFIAEQLSLNPEEMNLILLGAIEKDSELYKIAYQYIRSISFFDPDANFSSLDEQSRHSNFVLLNL